MNTLLREMEESARLGSLACYWHRSAKYLTIEIQCAKCNFAVGADIYTDAESGATPSDYSMGRALLAQMVARREQCGQADATVAAGASARCRIAAVAMSLSPFCLLLL